MTLESLLRDWPGECVVSRFDLETGAWIFIAIHSSRRGMPVGGTRIRVYSSPVEGLRDAMRLAEGMTYKWACLGIDKGGAKAVLAVPEIPTGEARRGLLLRYGALVESLRGAFGTGEDLGTTPEDMAILAEKTRYVHGIRGEGEVTDPGPFTAAGVLHGMRAAVREVLERETLRDARVAIQGVGDVGAPLARSLRQEGASLILADVDAGRAEALAAELDARTVPASQVYDVECDVFAPCAVGGVLGPDTIPRLRCHIVAGSANNQLADPSQDASLLHAGGIVYVPAYVINAGGALAFATMDGSSDLESLMTRMETIGFTVREILREARNHDESPVASAQRRAERALGAEGG